MAADKRNPSRHTEVERKFAVTETHRVSVVRRAVGRRRGGALARAAPRRRVLRHPRARSRRAPDHVAPPHRRAGRGLAPQAARRPRRAGPRSACRSATADGDTVPDELRDVVLAIVRDRPLRPVARIATTRTVDVLYGPSTVRARRVLRRPGDRVGRRRRRAAGLAGVGARARRGRGARRRRGAAGPAGQSAVRRGRRARRARLEAGRVLAHARGDRRRTRRRSTDPVHRAVAEQVERTAGVGPRRARRHLGLGASDAGDHPQDPQPAAGVGGVVRHHRRRLGARRTATAGRDSRRGARRRGARREVRDARSTNCPPSWSAARSGSAWSTARSGATRPGWKRSLVAMRSERYFRLLDALEALVAAEPPPSAIGRGARAGHRRRGVQEGAQGREEGRAAAADDRVRRGARRGAAPDPQARQAASLHRGGDWARTRSPSAPRRSSRCSATIRTASSAARTCPQEADGRARRG